MAEKSDLFEGAPAPIKVTLTLTPMQALKAYEAIGSEPDQAPAMRLMRAQIAGLLGIER